jgi:hypothetical protein
MATRKPANKAFASKAAVRKAPARKAPVREARAAHAAGPVSREARWQMIAEAAYHRARERDFRGGDDVADWLAAEAEVDARLRAEGREPRLTA